MRVFSWLNRKYRFVTFSIYEIWCLNTFCSTQHILLIFGLFKYVPPFFWNVFIYFHSLIIVPGSISNIEDEDSNYRCEDGSSPEIKKQVISGVVAAASSVTSIQVANLLKLFKIPQVSFGYVHIFLILTKCHG